MSKIEIEIPAGKEVDWEASAKQKKVVLRDKQLTYEDVCEELFKNGHYFVDTLGDIQEISLSTYDSNASTTKHQLECILAKNKLANVARYLNGEWKWELGSRGAFYIMDRSNKNDQTHLDVSNYCCYSERANVLFKSKEAALRAIEILGKEVVKMALEPLY